MLSQTLVKYSSLFLHDIDKNDIRIFLESSPLYPNLLSVMQTLRYVGLDSQAGQCDYEYLKNLILPFLLHLKSGKQEILVIAKWDDKLNCLKTYDLKTKRWNIKNMDHLRNYWDGVIIYTNNTQVNQGARKQFRILLSIILGLIAFALICFYNFKIDAICYCPIFIGFVISCCLYFKSGMSDGNIIDRLCRISKVTDCERVDESKYSSVFGFKMNCLVLSFFISQLTSIAIGYLFGINGMLYSLYFISAVISLPAIAYSAYGQFKIKNICPLCVIVVLCIAIESALFIFWDRQQISLNILALFSCIFIITVFISQYIYSTNLKEANHLRDRINLLKLMRKKEIILSESTPIKPLTSSIWLGEETSSIQVTTVISLSCAHCRKVVSEFITLQRKGLKFRWNIILGQTAQTDYNVIDIWIHQFLTDKEKFYEYLILWSNGIEQISSPLSKIKNIEISKIGQSFCNRIAELNISGFPQIILNNRLLPSIYTPKDLEFIIIDENI